MGLSLGTFGAFLLCQGQQQVDNLGYAALPVNLVEDGFGQLQRVPGASLPATTSAFIASCANPTFSADGTDTLATTDPMPPACDAQGATQCSRNGSTTVSTITTVTASPNPPVAGQAVTLTATVTAPDGNAAPAGFVQFEAGNTLIGSPVTLDSAGTATTSVTFTVAGTQLAEAAFTPTDLSFAPSTGTLTIMVASPSDTVPTTVTVTVPPVGAFTITVDSTDAVVMTVSGDTAAAPLNEVTVTDTRNTYPGWSVLGQVTDFSNPTSHPAGTISGDELGWAPDGVLADGAVLGPGISPAAPGLGTTPAVLASASAGNGFGTSSLSAFLQLAIPPTVPSGPYSGVLTLTAVTVGP
jgi:hypothetical protein